MNNVIYPDTGILLDCILFQQGYTKFNKKKKFDIREIDSRKAEFLISNISLIELTEHLKDSMASFMAINNGYSYFDLRKDRVEDIELTDHQLKEINQSIEKYLIDIPCTVSFASKGFNATEINYLVEMCKQYSIFLIDALHFLIADRENCNVFITNDKKLRKNLKKVLADLSSEHEMKIITSKEFKNQYFHQLSE